MNILVVYNEWITSQVGKRTARIIILRGKLMTSAGQGAALEERKQ
jgi:hypothetical protein